MGRVVTGSLQGRDCLMVLGDVLFPAVEQDLGLPQKLFQGNAVHATAYDGPRSEPSRRRPLLMYR